MEALKSQLLARRIIQPRFKWNMTEEQAADILLAAYKAEVEFRHGIFIADKRTMENCKKLAAFLTSGGRKFGVMLCGICGDGKTTMLYAFRSAMNYLSDSGAFENDRAGICIVNAKVISILSKDHIRFNDLIKAPMLGIDDLGIEATEVIDFGNITNPMIDLLEYRYNQQLFTFITTNLKADEVRRKYGDRIADRFNEMLEVIIFGNTSYRTIKEKNDEK